MQTKQNREKSNFNYSFSHVLKFNQEDIVRAWDNAAEGRLRVIENGQDRSYLDVLLPTCSDFIKQYNPKRVIDVGCGVGHLTKKILTKENSLVGVDPSKVAIKIAINKFQTSKNIHFINSDIETFSKSNLERFDGLVANMLLMDVLDLVEVLASMERVLCQGGKAIVTICHPCFWPQYWGYVNEEWFSYNKELAIKSDFRIKNAESLGAKTIHFHRPLESYLNAIKSTGLEIVKLKELFGPGGGKTFPFPRFMVIECVK
ncbi:MAG: class I SAM-dependent methyltransferase [Proteobacteria bacterium]|nr:class I SAM-dependent methyltransferase [Pseudomonadota bacterium]